jgi:Family of unknown function (DUF5343)
MTEEKKRTAAYLPWMTFKNSLDQLAKGMPSRIDRSVFAGLSWTAQNQLFIALRFLGLLKGDDEPTPLLHDLVEGTEEERKLKLTKIVRDSYADLIAIDLTKATKSHFEEKLGELYNVTGDTRVKAARFFVSAAGQLGISLSSFIAPAANENGVKRRVTSGRPRTAAKKATVTPIIPPAPDPTKPSGTSKSVSLVSGGTLTISATLDLFSLNAADRKFVFEIIDKLEAYEGGTKS